MTQSKSMKKAETYRTIGWIFTILGIMKYASFFVLMPYKFTRFIENPSAELFPAVVGSMWLLTFQYLLWIGIISHWRADRNEHPDQGSLWGKILLGFIIFTFLLWSITFILGRLYGNQ